MLEISKTIFEKSDLDSQKWCKIVSKIAIDTAMSLSLDCSSFGDAMDCLKYVKVKKIPVGGSESHAGGDKNDHHQNQPKQSCGAGILFLKNIYMYTLVPPSSCTIINRTALYLDIYLTLVNGGENYCRSIGTC